MDHTLTPVRSLPFRVVVWSGPLAAVVHNAEEYPAIVAYGQRHLSGLFGMAFPNARELLPAIVLTDILPFVTAAVAVAGPRRGPHWLPFFAVQAAIFANAFSHLGQSLLFMDYSPGTATGVLLSIPVNAYLFQRAYRDGVVSGRQLAAAAAFGVLAMLPAIVGLQYIGRLLANRAA